ncbi:MAG: sugar phosphate isomerase/epimerase [Verrucomicrobiota bacterium]|nr:sugar phosphate isomerase/epimerase [Verrucomicrobiota bacterium]
MNPISRRNFLKTSLQTSVAFPSLGFLGNVAQAIEPIKRTGAARFRVSLVAYSFRNSFNAKDAVKKIDLFQFIDFAAENNFDAVEITQYYFPKEVTTDYLIKLRRHAFLRGVAISGSGVGNNFALPKGEKLDEQIRKVKKGIDYAAILGAPYVRVFSGAVKDLDLAEAQKSCVAALEECAEYAGQKGIFLGLENDQGMTTTVEGTLALIKAANSKWLGSNLDTGNFHATEDVYGDLVKLAPYAINVHFKTQIHPKGKEPQPMDIARIFKILRDVNYQGYVAVEYEAKEDPFTAIPVFVKKLRETMAS